MTTPADNRALRIDQGMIHNSRLALSAVGEQQDVDTLTEGYQEE